MGKTHLVHPAVTQLGLRTSKQKKEVRRHLAHKVILGAISLAEGAREGFLGVLGPRSGLLWGSTKLFFLG